MSDNWITLIPEDPHFIPDTGKRSRARDRFAQIVPEADEIEIKVPERVEFFDCGTNLERILCPSCRSEIPRPWWEERMDEDCGKEFRLARYATPCCNTLRTLHELEYEWPQG